MHEFQKWNILLQSSTIRIGLFHFNDQLSWQNFYNNKWNSYVLYKDHTVYSPSLGTMALLSVSDVLSDFKKFWRRTVFTINGINWNLSAGYTESSSWHTLELSKVWKLSTIFFSVSILKFWSALRKRLWSRLIEPACHPHIYNRCFPYIFHFSPYLLFNTCFQCLSRTVKNVTTKFPKRKHYSPRRCVPVLPDERLMFHIFSNL